jgi:hypothetical protein
VDKEDNRERKGERKRERARAIGSQKGEENKKPGSKRQKDCEIDTQKAGDFKTQQQRDREIKM